MIEEEGMPARIERHREAGEALVEGLRRVRLPAAGRGAPPPADAHLAAAARRASRRARRPRCGGACSSATASRWAAGSAALAGQIWRIGLMGENARLTSVESLLSALRRELALTRSRIGASGAQRELLAEQLLHALPGVLGRGLLVGRALIAEEAVVRVRVHDHLVPDAVLARAPRGSHRPGSSGSARPCRRRGRASLPRIFAVRPSVEGAPPGPAGAAMPPP